MSGEPLNARPVTAALSDTLGLGEAAAMMRLGEDSLRELIVVGQIPAVSLNRKHWVILREDVLTFLRETAQRQASERRERIAAAYEAPPTPGSRRGRPRQQLS